MEASKPTLFRVDTSSHFTVIQRSTHVSLIPFLHRPLNFHHSLNPQQLRPKIQHRSQLAKCWCTPRDNQFSLRIFKSFVASYISKFPSVCSKSMIHNIKSVKPLSLSTQIKSVRPLSLSFPNCRPIKKNKITKVTEV